MLIMKLDSLLSVVVKQMQIYTFLFPHLTVLFRNIIVTLFFHSFLINFVLTLYKHIIINHKT